jgi:lsr operon transcriptional repressor
LQPPISKRLFFAGRLVLAAEGRRVVNPPLKELLKIPQIVLAAGGLQKLAIIRAGIRAKLCHVLITDEQVARALLET